MNLAISLKRAISQWPDKEAFVDGQKRLTYAEFGRRVAALTHIISNLGLGKGSTISVLAPNCLEFCELYFAAACLGAVLCPINYRLASAEIAQILEHSESAMLIAHTDFAEQAAHALENLSQIKLVAWLGAGKLPDIKTKSVRYEPLLLTEWNKELIDNLATGSDLAQIYYTSGTTGQAKGVMLTHENVAYNALGAVAELGLNDSHCWVHAAPMFHLVDAWAVFALTWVGGKHVFIPYFHADNLLPLLEAEAVTHTALVPTMINALLNSGSLWQYSYNALSTIMTAGSPIAPEIVKQIQEVFSCTYVQFYGMTETSPFLSISLPKSKDLERPKAEILAIRSKTGRPFIGVDLKIVKEDGSEVQRDGIEVGEIIARGPNVTKGYWKNQEATEQAIRNGWIYTGDLAVMDCDGYINVVDRSKDMIISGGENVYSTEVEYVLHEHPAVLECAVFGIPDEKWGELVHATVVFRAGQSPHEEELTDFVRERLARYKVPRHWEFLEELPKTGSGKIKKKELRDKFWLGRERRVN
ncbi:MAG: long-chain-fatty-acid--CoA ligase [Candidatus Obscuribacterales bacterium]